MRHDFRAGYQNTDVIHYTLLYTIYVANKEPTSVVSYPFGLFYSPCKDIPWNVFSTPVFISISALKHRPL